MKQGATVWNVIDPNNHLVARIKASSLKSALTQASRYGYYTPKYRVVNTNKEANAGFHGRDIAKRGEKERRWN